jgi:septum formation protein|tara:strand:+ start:195 stop:764 length:570 start_codon:yes stop_codon:yes gene_type:complete
VGLNYVLASGSPYRRLLLERLNIKFEIRSPNIDESRRWHESPEELVNRLSKEKAWAVLKGPEDLIIGSDQLAVHNGNIEGKPLTRQNNIEQLKRFSGQSVVFLTGLYVLKSDNLRFKKRIVRTEIKFRKLHDWEIETYVASEPAYECAGGFKAEGLGISLMESLTSKDPTAIVGLPLIALSSFLRELSI